LIYLWIEAGYIVSEGKEYDKVYSPQRGAIRANAEVDYMNEAVNIL
jgi:hypothetical protein